ncbi:translocation protein [Microthyrium microscopicum]|uniref:Translocation protein SEC62 n=1 Tax=Microthyrium microscopicum TaxID=703497 RepID=A0A6A6U9Q7_9PEZI|nr:translocation protein [Microthyrium microscopicum]
MDSDGPRPPPVQLTPGQQPTQEQIEAIQAHMHADAERMGLTFEAYIEKLKAMHQQQLEAQQQQQGQHVHGPNCNHDHSHDHEHEGQTQQQVTPGPPKPEALALASFLKNQDLKMRTCIFQEKRKDMFRVKRALRCLQTPAYEKARRKNPLLPPVTDRSSAEAVFKLLPLSLLALRVQKVDADEAHEGHSHGKQKRVKGLWTVEIVQQQDAQDDMYYMWLYEGPQWKQRAYAVGALVLVLIFVLFPLWPLKLRQGAWYLSMGFFGLIVAFFGMAIVRLILFCITMFTHPPGLWLYPNLFEDVGFFDSFRPVWAWQVDAKAVRQQKKLEREQKAASRSGKSNGSAKAEGGHTTGADHASGDVSKRAIHASVEEDESD